MKLDRILLEKTFQINAAVDFIYKHAFKDTVDAMKKGTWDGNFRYGKMKTTSLPGKAIEKANETNPATIFIHDDGKNIYQPTEGVIRLSLNRQVMDLVRQHGTKEAHSMIRNSAPQQYKMFKQEFDGTRIKSAIYHELSHWLDDTLHGGHLGKTASSVNTAYRAGDREKGERIRRRGKGTEFETDYERNAQIHAMKVLKKKLGKEWDEISFERMLHRDASLSNIYNILKKRNDGSYESWKRDILKRMHREKILGDEMTKTETRPPWLLGQ